jgi:hypothetical protein
LGPFPTANLPFTVHEVGRPTCVGKGPAGADQRSAISRIGALALFSNGLEKLRDFDDLNVTEALELK